MATGLTQRETAETLGISTKTIQRWQKQPEFLQALEATQKQEHTPQKTAEVAAEIVKDTWSRRDELRAKELKLLDMLEQKLLAQIESDGCGYRIVGLLLKISAERRKLLGLDVRNYSVIEAMEVLVKEEVASSKHVEIVLRNLENLESELIEHGIVND